MMTGRTTMVEYRGRAAVRGYRTAVSLHSHTNRSNEIMSSVPGYLARIPVVAPLARREMLRYTRRNGRPADFTKGWWRPPVSPRAVWDSETKQIVEVLGLRPLISITDHDSID